jgi:hypothetical protein
MKNFLYSIFLIFIFLLISAIIYLSTIGLETSKLNNLIVKEIVKKEPKIKVKLEKIKIKLDIKKIQLSLSTNNPEISYENIKIPVTKIKIYSKLKKILSSKIEVSQIVLAVEKLKVQHVQKIAIRTKPSNFKTYLLNNLEGGEIEKALFDLNIDKNFKLTDYKANGAIKKVNTKITNNFIIQDVGFNFIVDDNLILINSIKANYEGVSVSNGSINLQKKKYFEIEGKFNSQFSFKENELKKLFTKTKFFKLNKIQTQGTLLHEFNLKTNNSFKIIDYEYKSSGNILQSQIILKDSFKNKFLEKPVKKILFDRTKLEINFNKKNKNSLIFDGMYSTDESNYKKFKIKNNLNKKKQSYFIDLDLTENIFMDIINFRTNSKKISNVKSEFNINSNKYIFKYIELKEGKNSIFIEGLVLNNRGEIKEVKNINLVTFNNRKENNNLQIKFGKKISIIGDKYDSTYLLKSLSRNNKPNPLKNFNKEVEIKLKNLITKSKTPLNNFNLIGVIKRGQFNKISSKGEFSENQYLDISLKKDPNNNKILEIYSDLPQALLANYKFFEGIKNGKLLYNSIIDETSSTSKLTIENFKVIKAPAFATLLTLADLGGIADLLSGQGMSFDFLEINLKDNSKVTTVEEILALGSSVSLHMKGYIEKKTGLVSLSGTLVPAKTLNSLVSKIPIVGNILVGNKVGEGIFGVSFKMKGTPGNIKTTVNPVKTLTPRFITRAVERMKKR